MPWRTCLLGSRTRSVCHAPVTTLLYYVGLQVIPCFGVHPWQAHTHAMRAGTSGRDMIDPPRRGPSESTAAKTGSTTESAAALEAELLDSRPSIAWQQRLRELLEMHPDAWVGEFGLDRAAVIRGTKVRWRILSVKWRIFKALSPYSVFPLISLDGCLQLQVSFEHQLKLTEHHLRLAAEMRRPVSMHCVRAHGHLLELLNRSLESTGPFLTLSAGHANVCACLFPRYSSGWVPTAVHRRSCSTATVAAQRASRSSRGACFPNPC